MTTTLRLVTFGDLETQTWGVSAVPEPEAPATLAVRVGSASGLLEVELKRGEEGWQLQADGVSLAFAPSTAPVSSHDAETRFKRRDQPCEVTGHIQLEGGNAEVACLGWRSSTQPEAGLEAFESLRFLAAWFDAHAGFSLTSLRPLRARGHESDLVAAALLDEPPPRVADPRLSTTYTEEGIPVRAGLELWLEPEGEVSSEEDPSLPYARRAAGVAAAPGLDWNQGALALHATLMRWHSQGRDGAGVYVLGRRE